MFRQMLIACEDRDFLLILCRENPNEEIKVIRLCTVTYGLVSSPFQALRTMQHLCHDEGDRFPRAKEVLEERTYMDDSYGGENSLEEARRQREEFNNLLMAGGFPLSKWAANHSLLLEGIPQNQRASASLEIQGSEAHSVLGLAWHPATDTFKYKIKRPVADSLPITKRKVLVQAASLYDPLGWISPITVTFKIFMQSLWHMGVQWDDEIPPRQAEEWKKLSQQLVDLPQVSIPRYLGSKDLRTTELHGFADASEKAMAVVIYLRVIGGETNSTCKILISKTRAASLKQISLPRLKLNAAHMLATVVKNQVEALSLSSIPKFLWSDSTVALSWIKGDPTRWKTYVGNHVTSILESVPDASWSHVAGTLNPADLASRGASVAGLLSAPYWLNGPEFLNVHKGPWKADSTFLPLTKCPEERKLVHVTKRADIVEWDLLARYSSWDKLLRVTARCQQFVRLLSSRLEKKGEMDHSQGKSSGEIAVLEPKEIKIAEEFWLRHVQNINFAEEIRSLKIKKAIDKRSKILKLNPYIDREGLLRVGGRLKHSLLPDETKNQVILPKESALSKLIIQDTHLRTLHGGTQLVLNTIRQRFWIVSGRTAVKKITSSCVICWKQRPTAMTQLMGYLPAPRVRPARPFLHSGVDFACPISLRMSEGREFKTYKGYIVIFVCFSTRAIHLEVASDYSSEEFLAVYKRFIGRRGICDTLYSDCGTNFVGAE